MLVVFKEKMFLVGLCKKSGSCLTKDEVRGLGSPIWAPVGLALYLACYALNPCIVEYIC